jgi:hypothetical protein
MIVLALVVAALGSFYLVVRTPDGMTEEEYRQYFCTGIMGMK